MTDGIATWEYTYNTDGMRIGRSDGTKNYTYYYNGDDLRYVALDNHTLYFVLDPNGQALEVTYKDGTSTWICYYVRNLQGDVIAILDHNNNVVVEYSYDAWGNVLSVTGSMADTLGQLNPFRYRGYVYDSETGLYYVSSRYYDPEIGRWINADSAISGTGGDILGYNMFTYCFNNPVNMSDPTGNWPKWFENTVKVVSVVVAVATVVATVVAVSAFTAGTGSAAAVYGATIFLGAALSGINGGVANEAKGNSYINGYLGGATGGAIQSAYSKTPVGTILGGGAGVTVGTTVTDVMNNWDPDSSDSTAKEITSNALTSGAKALVTSTVTASIGAGIGGIDYSSGQLFGGVADGCGSLMPSLTLGFGQVLNSFFGWADDALVYIWE